MRWKFLFSLDPFGCGGYGDIKINNLEKKSDHYSGYRRYLGGAQSPGWDVRQNPALNAKGILTGIFNALNQFLEDRALEDDVTLVVVKVMDD